MLVFFTNHNGALVFTWVIIVLTMGDNQTLTLLSNVYMCAIVIAVLQLHFYDTLLFNCMIIFKNYNNNC